MTCETARGALPSSLFNNGIHDYRWCLDSVHGPVFPFDFPTSHNVRMQERSPFTMPLTDVSDKGIPLT